MLWLPCSAVSSPLLRGPPGTSTAKVTGPVWGREGVFSGAFGSALERPRGARSAGAQPAPIRDAGHVGKPQTHCLLRTLSKYLHWEDGGRILMQQVAPLSAVTELTGLRPEADFPVTHAEMLVMAHTESPLLHNTSFLLQHKH